MSTLVIKPGTYVGKRRRYVGPLDTQRIPQMDENGLILYVPRHAKFTRKEAHMFRKTHWTTKVARAFWRALRSLKVIDDE